MPIGTQVTVNVPVNSPLYQTSWFPRGKITGIVQKMYKNGEVAVAVDQLRNGSKDKRKTMNFPASWLTA